MLAVPGRQDGALAGARALALCVGVLLLLGLLMAYSANAPYQARTGDLAATWRPFVVHGVKLAVGLGMLVLGMRVRLEWLERHHGKLLLACLGLLLLVLVPGLGARINGARRWFQYGPFTLQPVEVAKVVVIVAVAARLHRMGDAVRRLVPCFALLGVVVLPTCFLLCLQPDFGSALLLAGLVFLLMIFAGARPLHYVPATVGGFGALLAGAWLFMPHVLERLTRHFNPQPGDQAYQSLVALGSGGFGGYGEGLGAGMAKLGYLPMISSDFVFAAVGEELGFLGSTLTVFLFLMLAVSATRIVLAQRDLFRFLLGAGITVAIAVQALINLVVVTAVTPTKGIALPFVSAGGSALAMALFAVGLLINLARCGPAVEPEPADPTRSAPGAE